MSSASPCPVGVVQEQLWAFLIRREASPADAEFVARTFAEKGFETLLRLNADADLEGQLAEWLPGSGLRISPSEVESVVFVHDLLPVAPNEAQRREAPRCDNARALITRNALRGGAGRLRGKRGSLVPAVATESSAQAWSLLEALAPARIAAIAEEMRERSAAFPALPRIRDLSHYAARARVELIDYNGTKAVRKTFRPGKERFLQRELAVLTELGPLCPQLPKLLDYGANHYVIEYIEEAEQLRLPTAPALLPLAQVRQLAAFVRIAIAHGWDPVDLKPRANAIYTRSGVRVIDYEFWRRCDPATPPEDSYCLSGLPLDYQGDRPWGGDFGLDAYATKWKRIIGLNPGSFLYDPAWLQVLKRAPWWLRARSLRLAIEVVRPLARRVPLPGRAMKLILIKQAEQPLREEQPARQAAAA